MKIFFWTTIFWFLVVSAVFAYLKGVFGPNEWAKMLFPCEVKQETTCSTPTTGFDALMMKIDEVNQKLEDISTKLHNQADASSGEKEASAEGQDKSVISTGASSQEEKEQSSKKPSSKKSSSESNQ